MTQALIVQQPTGPAQQLILLFHGFRGAPKDMQPLGQRLAAQFPQAWVVCECAPHACAPARGHCWYDVAGLEDDDVLWQQRVMGAMPQFVQTVQAWQERSGVGAPGTALMGFSQGGIMSLAATRDPAQHLAGRVVSVAGCYITLPQVPVPHTTFHFVHGKEDKVMPYARTVEAGHHLVAIGADVTADVIPFSGHTVTGDMIDLVLQRLQSHIPKRLWDEALAAQPQPGDEHE